MSNPKTTRFVLNRPKDPINIELTAKQALSLGVQMILSAIRMDGDLTWSAIALAEEILHLARKTRT